MVGRYLIYYRFKSVVYEISAKWLVDISYTIVSKVWYMRYRVGKNSGI